MSQALVLARAFDYPDIYRRSSTEKNKQSRRFQESTDDNFLTQVVENLTRNGMVSDFTLTKTEGLVADVRLAAALAAVTMRLQIQ